MEYSDFLERKTHLKNEHGFEPVFMPDDFFNLQSSLVGWAILKGRAAILADCGLGKTYMQLVWAQNVVIHTNKRVLILTPLAVGAQTVREGERFGIDCYQSRDGKWPQDKKIIVTNYEKLHLFNPADFVACVCDESSILKNYAGATRDSITTFMRDMPYRLLCTATAAPNDYIELGTSSEALGVMERKHMLAQYFTHDSCDTSKWVLKGHARKHLFWRWVCSWARACRKPSDLGFDDNGFILPPMIMRSHTVMAKTIRDGYLFDIAAVGLDEQREDLRRTLHERCELVASLVSAHDRPAVCWTNLNAEADLIAKLVNGAVNVQGSDSDEKKEDAFINFADGKIRVLISKPSIAGFGLNWQHCAHMTFFPSHSYEQFYQCTRRCWRFGQKSTVTTDIITTEGQQNVLQNMERKSEAASAMFDQMIGLMNKEIVNVNCGYNPKKEAIPLWLK